jgi:ABC-type phosphate transport system substrate-binding protein
LKRIGRLALALAALLGVFAAIAPAQAAPPSTTNGKVGRVWISGSDTTYFVLNDLAEAYNETEGCTLSSVNYPELGTEHICAASQPAGVVEQENYDHDLVVNYFPQGSNAGRRQLCSQGPGVKPAGVPVINAARSSSAPDVGFQCDRPGLGLTNPTFRFVAFAKDALTWVWFTGQAPAPTTNLTQSQLNDIFVDCTINNWSQIGGENQPIVVWTAIPGSGSRSSWDTFIGGSTDSCIPALYKDGNPATPAGCPGERVIREHIMTPVETDPCAPDEEYSIYFSGVGTWNGNPTYHGPTANLGNVNGVTPSEANIQSGTFPFTRLMYNVVRVGSVAPTVSNDTLNFLGASGYLCKRLDAHNKPIGDPGPGVAVALASKNYGQEMVAALTSNGFIPLTSATNLNRCQTTDWISPDVL